MRIINIIPMSVHLIFRHVSPAFTEDPVRLLRLARFAARYGYLGFMLAQETKALLISMVTGGEVDYLVPERVWAELVKALKEPNPSAFFYALKDCGALAKIFPEIDALFGVPQPAQYHPEIDTGIHALMCLQQAVKLSEKPEVRFAALVHDLGKGLTLPEYWPSHHGHEQKGLPVLDKLCARLRVPNSFKSLARQVMEYHTHCHKAYELRATTLTDVLQNLGAYKTDNSLADFLLACEADAKGRTGFEDKPYPQAELFSNAALAANAIDNTEIINSGLKGPEFGEALRRLRIKAITEVINSYKSL